VQHDYSADFSSLESSFAAGAVSVFSAAFFFDPERRVLFPASFTSPLPLP